MNQAERPLLQLTRVLPASPAVVFAAWTDPEAMKRWMCPGAMTVPIAELDVRVGGRYRIVMRNPSGEFEHVGEYREVDPPHRLAFTWISAGTDRQETLVTLDVRAQGEATELVLTHERFPHAESRDKHQGGWGAILDCLDEHLQATA